MSDNIIADRVKEYTITSGTGSVTLEGAVDYFQSFLEGVGVGNSADYALLSGNGFDWEVGVGTLQSASLWSRDTINASSNGGAPISLSGTSIIFSTASARLLNEMRYINSSGGFGDLVKQVSDPPAPGVGYIRIYAVQGTGSTATIRVKAGTDETPVDLLVDVGSNF